MRQLTTVVLFCMFAISTTAQSVKTVIVSAGASFKNTKGSISWSFGEVVSETFIYQESILTQGFHQKVLKIKDIDTEPGKKVKINIGPNPSKDFITIKSLDSDINFLTVSLFDIGGKTIINRKSVSNNQQIDIRNLSSGLYLLRVYDLKGLIKTYKIIKE